MLVYHYQNWYIVGGGDNKSVKSCNILYFILAYDASFNNMSKLGWSVLTRVKERDPLASEVNILCLFQHTLL